MVTAVVRLQYRGLLEPTRPDVEAQQHHRIKLVLVRLVGAALPDGHLIRPKFFHQPCISFGQRHRIAHLHALCKPVADSGHITGHWDVRARAEAF